jgi:NAD(P)-dependent dehydrogenase (short-subunit alcohol dehydrogenase family)
LALAIAGVTTLYLNDIKEKTLRETQSLVEELPLEDGRRVPTVVSIAGDISCPLFVDSLFRQIPQLHYAVNCAGILGPDKLTTDTSLCEFDKVTDINYRAIFMCMKEELKIMMKNDIKPYSRIGVSSKDGQRRGQRGAIVNIASQLGIVGKSRNAPYTATKAAVCSLTRSDAIDYSSPPKSIRINAICPGVIKTPMTTNPETGEPVSEDMKKSVSIAPMDRMGLPSEIADAAVFLCSGESSFMTGASMVVDGGYTIV